jgi:hypothetical protein
LAEWFSGPCNPHQIVFVKTIDLVVRLLGPDLDVVITKLTSLGRRHNRYIKDMQKFLHEDEFQSLLNAFVQTLKYFLQQESEKKANEIGEESILHAFKTESIQAAWEDTFTMIRVIMKQGVNIEINLRQKRLQKGQQRQSSGQCSSAASDTASVTSSLLESPTASDILQTPAATQESVRMQAKDFLRSPPLRSRSE